MQLIPAIDLLDGRCVRLLHGDFARCTVYPDSATAIAARYAQAGTRWLHVVDLAASRDGLEADTGPLFELLNSASQKVQTGGGVRSTSDIEARLQAGADRVVVGSIAAEQPGRFAEWLEEFSPRRLVAALDVRRDENNVLWVRSRGWTRDSGQDLWALLDELCTAGLSQLLCTDITRDGALTGPNLSLYRSITDKYPGLEVQASGGIRNVTDLLALSGVGASAAISGKALLDGVLDLQQALDALS